MPLLQRQPFVKEKPPPGLTASDEVFFCSMTGEVFSDYDLVWTCGITGKTNLTYQEALESETSARKQLDFSPVLTKLMLYLISLTKRTNLKDLLDDIYSFMKDRFFINEIVDVTEGKEKRTCRVKTVLHPLIQNGHDIDKPVDLTADSDDENSDVIVLDELEEKKSQTSDDETDPCTISYIVFDTMRNKSLTVTASEMNRKKSVLTRDKCRLFLKANCEVAASGHWAVKAKIGKRQKLEEMTFNNFFSGPKPKFEESHVKKNNNQKTTGFFEKRQSGGQDEKAEARRLAEKLEKMTPMQRAAYKEKELQERKRKLEEEKAKRKEERDKEREKKKEEKKEQEAQLREWRRIRDDMECNDLRPLPAFHPVRGPVSVDLFGDVIMLLEFFNIFGQHYELKSHLHSRSVLKLENFLAAFNDTKVDGLFVQLLKFLLNTLFQIQREEDEDIDGSVKPAAMLPDGEEEYSELSELIRFATQDVHSVYLHYGASLGDLELNQYTLTEMLRLHLLCAGARATNASRRFRHQHRGAFADADEPALWFKLQEQDIMQELSRSSVLDLQPVDKVKIMQCLVHQIMTYVAFRDVIDDHHEKIKTVRQEIANLHAMEKNRDQKERAFWFKKKQDQKAKEKQEEEERKEAAKEGKAVKPETEEEEKQERRSARQQMKPELYSQSQPSKSPLKQSSRLQRKNDVKLKHLLTLDPEKIEWDGLTEEQRTRMRELYLEQERDLLDELRTLQHGFAIYPLGKDRLFRRYWMFSSVAGIFIEDDDLDLDARALEPVAQLKEEQLHDQLNNSDKENLFPDGAAEKEVKSEDGNETDSSVKMCDLSQQLSQKGAAKWSYLESEAEIDALLQGLNPRGARESALRLAIADQRQWLSESLADFESEPVRLSAEAALEVEQKHAAHLARRTEAAGAMTSRQSPISSKQSATEILELNLREHLLDLEENIHVGGLGKLQVRNRQLWRETLEGGNYDPQTELDWFNDRSNTDGVIEEKRSRLVIKNLACALHQIKQMLDLQFVGPPLGEDKDRRQEKKKAQLLATFRKAKGKSRGSGDPKDDENSCDEEEETNSKLERWDSTLRKVTSLSQIFLYHSVLENSIEWEKSALQAKCKICRKKGDADKMLLCDGCNLGFHMYCLTPKLTAIPRGDWYCLFCKPKELRTPMKRGRRRITYEEDSDSEEGGKNESACESSTANEDTEKHTEDTSEDEQRSGDDTETSQPRKIRLPLRATRRGRRLVETSSVTSSGRSTPVSDSSEAPARTRTRSQQRGHKRQLSYDPDQRGSSSKRRGNTQSELKIYEKLVEEITMHEDSWPFIQPVTKRDAPDYFTIIATPMDLMTIRVKMRRLEYDEAWEIIDDLRLVFDNCLRYNEVNSEEYKCADRLGRLVEKRVRDLRTNTSSKTNGSASRSTTTRRTTRSM